MVTLLLIFQIIITIVLVISIMLQKSSSIGLGGYSGSNESLFGAKGPAGFLAKFTAIMAVVFVVNTIGLSYFYQKNKNSSVIDKILNESTKSAVPSVPLAPKSVNETSEQKNSDTLDTNESKNLPVTKAMQNDDANLSTISDTNATKKTQNTDTNISEANSTK